MKRYKVVAFGGHEGLLFDELLVKFSGGYQLPLKVKQGEYIPLEILDPMDIKKSLIAGSLGRYIRGGQVVEENYDPKKERLASQVLEVAAADKVAETKPQPIIAQPISESKSEPKHEPVVSAPPPPISGPEPLLESISQVKVEEDFYKLGFFMKVKFIENCSDKALLARLLEKTKGSHQLQTNIQLKLAALR